MPQLGYLQHTRDRLQDQVNVDEAAGLNECTTTELIKRVVSLSGTKKGKSPSAVNFRPLRRHISLVHLHRQQQHLLTLSDSRCSLHYQELSHITAL